MASSLTICEIDEEVKAKLKKFRFRKEKNIAAIVLKIDPDNLRVVEDEEYEDVTFDEIVGDLAEHLPRYIILSYVYDHGDGRVSYPLVYIFLTPSSTKPELQMMYAGTKLEVQNALGLTKTFEVRDVEELTEDWLKSKLAFFR